MKANEINDGHGPKVRADSWAAKLTPNQHWQLFRKAKQSNDWMDAVDWAKKEFQLDISPSRSSYYSWMAAMHRLECEDRLKKIGFAVAQATALGKKMPNDERIFATFKMLAFEAAVTGDVKAADTYVKIADTIQKLHYKQLDFEWEEADRKRKAADWIEKRDAIRQRALEYWSCCLGKSFSETVEYLRNRNACLRVFTKSLYEPLDQWTIKEALKKC